MSDLSRLSKHPYDLLVVGGGINGASIANVAALAGARVALIEKADWSSGTSSKSTKLLHGGIRYLENLEFDLVSESLRERFIQWKSAPHLVKPMRFIIPVYRGQGRPFWMMRLGVWLYDCLSGRYSLGRHSSLTKEQVMALSPGIKTDGLIGGVAYFDAQMDDVRICLENVLMAKHRGADVSNNTEVIGFLKQNGQSVGVKVRHCSSNNEADIYAKKIVVTAGPWTDQLRRKDSPKIRPRLRPTKGVHLVYRGSIGKDAFLIQSKGDKRIFFMIPFKGNILIGTTDTDYKGSPNDVSVEDADIDYLLTQANLAFPSVGFSREGIIESFAGLRPLVNEHGAPSKVSRKFALERAFSGVYYVMGGKYTTYRAIALDTVSRVLPELAKHLTQGDHYTLYGSYGYQSPLHDDVRDLVSRLGINASVIHHLISVYGTRYHDVLDLIRHDPSLKAPICSCSETIRAQVVYAVKTEMARNADDIYERRLGLQYVDCPTRQCRQVINDILTNL